MITKQKAYVMQEWDLESGTHYPVGVTLNKGFAHRWLGRQINGLVSDFLISNPRKRKKQPTEIVYN